MFGRNLAKIPPEIVHPTTNHLDLHDQKGKVIRRNAIYGTHDDFVRVHLQHWGRLDDADRVQQKRSWRSSSSAQVNSAGAGSLEHSQASSMDVAHDSPKKTEAEGPKTINEGYKTADDAEGVETDGRDDLPKPNPHLEDDDFNRVVNFLSTWNTNDGCFWKRDWKTSLGLIEAARALLDLAEAPTSTIGGQVKIHLGSKDRRYTALHAAAHLGNGEAVQAFLRNGAEVNSVDQDGHTPLFLAARNGHLPVVRVLLDADADLTVRDACHGFTPLLAAAKGGHAGVVLALLERGAEKDVGDKAGATPVMWAISARSPSVLDTLLSAGVSLDEVPPGFDPLIHLAARCGSNMVSFALANGARPYAVDSQGRSALHVAAEVGDVATLDTLLETRIDIDVRHMDGNFTPLHLAAMGRNGDMVSALVGHGADVEAFSDCGSTALCLAAACRRTENVRILLDADASVNNFDPGDEGWCALTHAAVNGDDETLRLLLRRGADVEKTDIHGRTPLHWVCATCSPKAVKATDLLLRAGADETTKSLDGRIAKDFLVVDAGDEPGEEGALEHHSQSPKRSQEVVDAVRCLLVSAPKDRLWRRRCVLVMLRARTKTVVTPAYADRATEGNDGGPLKVARMEEREGGMRGDQQGSVVTGVECGAGSLVGVEGLRGVIETLIHLQIEGVFRTVVGFF
eukprot:g5576.t1